MNYDEILTTLINVYVHDDLPKVNRTLPRERAKYRARIANIKHYSGFFEHLYFCNHECLLRIMNNLNSIEEAYEF